MIEYTDVRRKLARNIAIYRKGKKLTQQQLAERAGISRGHMSYIEAYNMSTSCSLKVLIQIANALEVELVDLFELILPPNKNPANERSFCAVAASPSSQRSCRLRLLPAPCHDAKILAHLLGFLSGASIKD